MRDYNRTLWENNKTVVDADNLNNIEDQLLIITNSMAEELERVQIIEDTLPMKANINHTHEDLATIENLDNIKNELESSINNVKVNIDNITQDIDIVKIDVKGLKTELISSIESLKLEIKEEFKKYYDHAEIEDNVLKLYSNNILLTSLQLPVGQAPTIKSICGEFLCGEEVCNDYSIESSLLNEINTLSYDKTIWQDGVTPVNATNLNKIENKLLELSDKLQELSETGVDLADNFIHTGSETPTSTKGIWIDNSDNEELAISNPIVEQFAAAIKKQQEQIAELFYITDAYLDDGLFEDDDSIAEEFDGGVF